MCKPKNARMKNQLRLFCFFIFLAVVISACNPDGSSPGYPENKTCAWTAELLLTGGFAGVERSISLSSSGQATITDLEKNARTELQLPAEKMKELTSLLIDAGKFEEYPLSNDCVDCFNYAMVITLCDSTSRLTFDDVTIHQSGLKPFIFELMNIMFDAVES